MKIKVQVVIESDGGDTKAVENIACLKRGALRPEDIGADGQETTDALESAGRPPAAAGPNPSSQR